MNTYKKFTLALFALTIIAIGVPMATASSSNVIAYQYSAGMASVEFGDLAVRVTGHNQAPHFQWWNTSDSDLDPTSYHVMFVKMFEANDTNTDTVYDTSNDTIIGDPYILPTIGWEFSGFVNSPSTQLHFNFTTTETDVNITVCIHMDLDTPDQFKFDVIVDNWTFTEEDSLFVLMFTMNENAVGDNDPGVPVVHRLNNKWSFGDAFFEYCETAEAAGHSVNVESSFGDGNAIFLSFENFGNDATLVYDPILGISSTPEAVPAPDVIPNIMTVGILSGITIAAILAIVLIKRR